LILPDLALKHHPETSSSLAQYFPDKSHEFPTPQPVGKKLLHDLLGEWYGRVPRMENSNDRRKMHRP
jgi:hypothetical protein